MTNVDRLECIDPEVGELLPFHANGTLGGADRQLVAAHLKACARCAEEEQLMREVARGIANLRLHPDPAASLAITTTRRRGTRVWVATAIGIAAALAAWLAGTSRDAQAPAVAVADVRALEARVHHLESQNAALARTIAQERAHGDGLPLASIPIASPPNL